MSGGLLSGAVRIVHMGQELQHRESHSMRVTAGPKMSSRKQADEKRFAVVGNERAPRGI